MNLALQLPDARGLAAKAAEAARLLVLLASQHRLAILCELIGGERSVGALVAAVGLSQSALSQHLAKLRTAGIVTTRREAQTVHYRLASAAAASVMKTLADIYCGRRPLKGLRRRILNEKKKMQIKFHGPMFLKRAVRPQDMHVPREQRANKSVTRMPHGL